MVSSDPSLLVSLNWIKLIRFPYGLWTWRLTIFKFWSGMFKNILAAGRSGILLLASSVFYQLVLSHATCWAIVFHTLLTYMFCHSPVRKSSSSKISSISIRFKIILLTTHPFLRICVPNTPLVLALGQSGPDSWLDLSLVEKKSVNEEFRSWTIDISIWAFNYNE